MRRMFLAALLPLAAQPAALRYLEIVEPAVGHKLVLSNAHNTSDAFLSFDKKEIVIPPDLFVQSKSEVEFLRRLHHMAAHLELGHGRIPANGGSGWIFLLGPGAHTLTPGAFKTRFAEWEKEAEERAAGRAVPVAPNEFDAAKAELTPKRKPPSLRRN